MIEVKNLTFRYSEVSESIIRNMSINVDKGQIAGVHGKNGSGKTTLLYLLCGIIPHYFNGILEGDISVNGTSISTLHIKEIISNVNILFQNPDFQIAMPTVEEEIAFAPENLCIPKDVIIQRIREVLDILNISHLRYRKTNNLSFGEKKMVVLASILATSPKVILIDEFSSGISDQHLSNFKKVVEKLANKGTTFVIADHNEGLLSWAGKQICLSD